MLKESLDAPPCLALLVYDLEAKVPHERLEVPVLVQKLVTAQNALGRDQTVDHLSNSEPKPTQFPEVPGRRNRNLLATQIYDIQQKESLPRKFKIPIICETLQNFRKNEVADQNWFHPK